MKEESKKAGLKLNSQKRKIMASGPITSWQIVRQQWKQWQTLSSRAPKSPQMVTTVMEIKRYLLLGRKAMTNLDSILKSRDITLVTKVCIVKATWFSSSHVQMWELDHKEGWAPKNWCFPVVVLEKTPESPFDSKEIQPVHPKGNHSWIFTEGLMLKLWYSGHLMQRADSLEKTLTLGRSEGRRRGWQSEMVGWHQLNGHGSEQTPGDSEGQGSLACCGPWGLEESDRPEWLNNKLCDYEQKPLRSERLSKSLTLQNNVGL